MQFTVETISEDSFYANLLLGLPKFLSKLKKQGVKGHTIRRFPPFPEDELISWEQNNVLLPQDLKKFYASTNGFLFSYNVSLRQDEPDMICKIEINPLEKLTELKVEEIDFCKDENIFNPTNIPVRFFELVNLGNDNMVVLVFGNYKFANNVWIYTSDGKFSFLSADFTTYFRMCIAHLGIPNWQLRNTRMGMPQWLVNFGSYLAPHLLEEKHEDMEQEDKNWINKLDVNVFKVNYSTNLAKKSVVRKKVGDNEKYSPKSKFRRVNVNRVS